MDMTHLAEHALAATNLLKQLANDKRLMVCCCLGDEELSVSELNTQVPLSQSALSQHLAKMREANIVSTRREGKVIYYRLANENVLKIINILKDIYCPE